MMTSKPRNLWPFYVPLVLLLGAYMGVNEFIDVRSVAAIAAWKPFIWDMTSVVVIGALIPLVVFCRNPTLMGNLVNRRRTNWAAYAVSGVIVVLNVYLLFQTIL